MYRSIYMVVVHLNLLSTKYTVSGADIAFYIHVHVVPMHLLTKYFASLW